MTTKLEEVARAIEAVSIDDGTYGLSGDDAMAVARAAVAAMQEPSEAMIHAGTGDINHHRWVPNAYRAMIDAVLNEKPE